ncbi:intermembrane transport protein PqiB [Pelagicoccus sp. SDUM812003]|uniref:intermembrane transport protein PqiB n=1 Tax=Pelagicoccus sp. SDUM812003 TaxID=3041267 RepID=UPI00280E69A5|nr:intermembrane transport protein PqiB [Pelagicoccus sp. SDUM812003]MDQ8201764.1 intermembrane transport protein PqiB [Pelagicoccus sp. SDUM812003]
MSEVARVSKQRRVSSIWIIPAVALAIGAWMIAQALLRADAKIEIRFETARGIEAGRTEIRARNVEVGLVENVRLSEDSQSVVVEASVQREAAHLLRKDSSFWVVRPRIGLGGVSGVGTLLSGAYIELEPGSSSESERAFVGLEEIPATPSTARGLRVQLESDAIGSVKVGDPILFRGTRAGQVDSARFSPQDDVFLYDIFIAWPYDAHVTTATRFWKASAISIDANTNGFSVSADSLESILSGGVAFDLPEGLEPGEQPRENQRFRLYRSYEEINRYPYKHYVEYLFLFNDSVRGLNNGAPVEYRGIPIGHVVDVSFGYLDSEDLFSDEQIPVPALARIYPGYIELSDSPESVERVSALIEQQAERGLKASLQHGNLLTGSLFVEMDFYPNEEPQSIRRQGGHTVFPTRSVGLKQIQRKVTDILTTIESLPLEDLSENIGGAALHASEMMQHAKEMLSKLETLLDAESVRDLPGQLDASLEAVQAAMEGLGPQSPFHQKLDRLIQNLNTSTNDLRRLLIKLENRPSELIFSSPAEEDPEPRAPQP